MEELETAITAEAQAELQERREVLVKDLNDIRAKEEAEAPARAERVQRSASKVAEAEEALRGARQAHGQAYAEDHGARTAAQ